MPPRIWKSRPVPTAIPPAFSTATPRLVVASFDGDPKVVTEMDALVAYLQVLGTLVDFTKYQPADFKQ